MKFPIIVLPDYTIRQCAGWKQPAPRHTYRKFHPLIFFLFFTLQIPAQEIPNGIYLLSSAESRSFYPTKDSAYITDMHDHKITLLNMPGPFFGEKDFYRAEYTLALTLNAGQNAWCFEFSLVESGNVKRNELIERDAVLPFVFVFNEKEIASGKLFQKGSGSFIHLAATCSYGEIQNEFQSWAKSLYANFDKQWNPLTRDSVYYYTNGKPAEDHFFKNGNRIEVREWYYSGQLKEMRYDSAGFICRREYDSWGKLEHFECRKGFSKREDWYELRFSGNGKISYKDSCYGQEKNRFELQWSYDSTGTLTMKSLTRYLDFLPGDADELNNPMLIDEHQYKNGVLISEGESFWTSTESGGENCGTWKYYENGKLVKTEKFPGWKTFYRKAGGKI